MCLVFAGLFAVVIGVGIVRNDFTGVYAVSPVGILVVTWLIGAEGIRQIARTKQIKQHDTLDEDRSSRTED